MSTTTSKPATTPSQTRRAIRPTSRRPATSWAEPGSTRVIRTQRDGTAEPDAAGRLAASGRGAVSVRPNPGEETGGMSWAFPVLRTSGCDGPVSPVTSVTRVTARRVGRPAGALASPRVDLCRRGLGRGGSGAGSRTVPSAPWQTVPDATRRAQTSPATTGSTAPAARVSAAPRPPPARTTPPRCSRQQPRGPRPGPRDPEPTQMLPTVPRPGSSSSRPSGAGGSPAPGAVRPVRRPLRDPAAGPPARPTPGRARAVAARSRGRRRPAGCAG